MKIDEFLDIIGQEGIVITQIDANNCNAFANSRVSRNLILQNHRVSLFLYFESQLMMVSQFPKMDGNPFHIVTYKVQKRNFITEFNIECIQKEMGSTIAKSPTCQAQILDIAWVAAILRWAKFEVVP